MGWKWDTETEREERYREDDEETKRRWMEELLVQQPTAAEMIQFVHQFIGIGVEKVQDQLAEVLAEDPRPGFWEVACTTKEAQAR